MSKVIRPHRIAAEAAIDKFIMSSKEKYSDYSYAAGFMETVILSAIEKLPAKEAARVVKLFDSSFVHKE